MGRGGGGNLTHTITISTCCPIRGFKTCCVFSTHRVNRPFVNTAAWPPTFPSPVTFRFARGAVTSEGGKQPRWDSASLPWGCPAGNMKYKNKFKHGILGGLFYDARARIRAGWLRLLSPLIKRLHAIAIVPAYLFFFIGTPPPTKTYDVFSFLRKEDMT